MLADVRGYGGLAGVPFHLMHPGREGLDAGFERLNRKRDGREQRAQHAPAVHPDERRDGRHHGGAVDERETFLGSEADGLEIGQLQGLERRHAPSLIFHAAHADERARDIS